MPLDPVILAINNRRPVTPEVLCRAKDHRLNRINELWAEVRVIERLLEEVADVRAVLAERDPPIEAAEHSRH